MIVAADRPLAPFGSREMTISTAQQLGPYSVIECIDHTGPMPRAGQFYMLSLVDRWGGEEDGRPYLGRAFSVARAAGAVGELALSFFLEGVGPGTRLLAAGQAGEQLKVTGPFGNGFELEFAGRPLLVGGGIGAAPLLALADQFQQAQVEMQAVLLGFRSSSHALGADLFSCATQVATDGGSVGHPGFVTDLLQHELSVNRDVTIFSCGPPAMLESVRQIAVEAKVPAQLALETGMACGFGSCFGCAVPVGDGYVRLCVDGPVLCATDISSVPDHGPGSH